MGSLFQDLRFGLRQLRKAPSFSLTALLTLALGIGASTALFSVVDAVLLKPLAYQDSGRLVVIWERVRYLQKVFPYTGPNPRHAEIWHRQATAFSDLSLLKQGSTGVSLHAADHPVLVGRIVAEPNLLDILGVQPALGRNFLPEESIEGRDRVAIISNHLWKSLFQADPSVLGRPILIAGAPVQIVGVLPENFYFPKSNELSSAPVPGQRPDNEILTPLVINPATGFSWNGDYGNFVALARLKPGISVAQATQNLDSISDFIARQIPAGELDGPIAGALATYVQPLKQVLVGRLTIRLWLLMAAVLSVLLIACINLANAQLARLATRERETALRAALGASAARLLQSAIAETAILSLLGGSAGVALAFLAVHRVAGYAATAIPRANSITLSLPVLALSGGLTLASATIFGVLPALRLLHIDPQRALQGAGRAAGSRRSNALSQWLVGAQAFACIALLLVAALFARSLVNLSSQDKGFSSSNVVVATVYLQGKEFDQDSARTAFDDGVLEKLRTIPGVQSTSLVSYMLLNGDSWIDGIHPTDNPTAWTLANYRWIGPDYFSALQQPILEGRALDARDRTAHSAVISQAAARATWPSQDPLNRQFRRQDTTFTVVGVAADAHNNSLRDAPVSMVYLPYWDNPPYSTYFLVRTTQDPTFIESSVRKAIWSYNSAVTIARVQPLETQLQDTLAPESLQTGIFLAFAGAALLLALLGIYGTLSNSVQARTQEVGIRMALGASPGNVYALMLRTILLPVSAGLAAGLATGLATGKVLSSLLYGTTATDPAVVAPVLGAFLVASIAAAWLPCRRAAHIEPADALRST